MQDGALPGNDTAATALHAMTPVYIPDCIRCRTAPTATRVAVLHGLPRAPAVRKLLNTTLRSVPHAMLRCRAHCLSHCAPLQSVSLCCMASRAPADHVLRLLLRCRRLTKLSLVHHEAFTAWPSRRVAPRLVEALAAVVRGGCRSPSAFIHGDNG